MEGTNPALENAHKIAQKKGFKGDINSFKNLISTNEGALGDVYNSVRSQGYNKDINSFRTLVGIEVPKKKKVSSSTSDSQKSVSEPQAGSSDILEKNNEKARSIPKGTKFRLATEEEAQAAADRDILAKRKSGKEGETVVTPFTEQEKKNIGYKPKNISKEKIEDLYSLDKDGLIKKAPENEFSKFADFNTSPENKAILKGALQKHDQATTVDETFINDAVAEADEIASGNNTWENVKSGVKGAFNTFLGQNIGLTNVATKLGINPYQNTDPLAEEKTKARKKLIDSGIEPKKINDADVLNEAKKIYAENKIKDKKLSLSNDFYDNLDDKEKEALELKFTYDKSKLTDEDNRLIQNLKLTKARIKDLTFDAEPILAKIKNKEQISPEEFKIVENLDKQIILHNDIYNDYQSNSKNLLSAEEELDLVKREYGEVQNFVADVGTAGLRIGLGALQTAKTALIDYNPAFIALNELSKLNNGTEEAGGIIDEISSNLDLGLGKAQSELENWNQNTFRKNTENFNNVNDGIDFVTDLIGNQAPNIALMITTGGGSALATRLGVEGNQLALGSIGAYSYGNKKNEMIGSNNSEDPNNRTYYSNTQIELASILYGGSEMFETATLGSLGKTKRFIGASLAEAPTRELFRKSIKDNIISGLKSNSKDVLEENIEEQVTNLIQNYTERNVLGRNEVGLFDNAGEVLKSSTAMALLLKAPQFAGAVAKKFQPKQYNDVLDNNAKEVLSLMNEFKKEGLSKQTQDVIGAQITKLSQESDAIVKKTFERISKLPAEQIDKVVELEKSTAELRAKAEAVQNDEALSKETKEKLIKDLSSQYKTQENLRTKIVSEKATILDILPENEVTDLKKKAVENLLVENAGKNEANFTEEVIDEKAIELYNNKNQSLVEQTKTDTKEPVAEVNPVPSVSNEITPTENVSPIENVVSPEVANPIQEENKNVIDNYNNKLAFTRELFSGDENRFNEFVEKSKELEDVNQVDKFIEDNLPKSFNQNEDLIAPLKETIINGINNKQIKQNEATPSQDIADDGNIRPSDAVVDQDGSANKGDNQGSVQQPSNLQGNNGQEIVLDDVANFLNEQFGAEKPVVNPTPSPEVVKEIEPKAVKVEEEPKQTKAQQAKGFVSMAINSLATSLKDFQGRSKEYSEQTYNRIVNEAKEGVLNISSIPPIQIWRNPDTGKFTILAGHSRTKAFSDLASGKVEFSDKYKKSDFENINSQIVEAETLEEAQKIAQESNQGAVQTVVDNAKYVRESLLPTFKNFNQAKTKLKSLYGSAWARIYAYANLNPKGKAMQMLKQFQDSNESDSDDKSKRIAEWTGKARNEFENLTDAHENEIFDYLLKNDKVKTYAELSELLNRRVNGLEEFNPNEPLNFEQKVGRGSNEVEILKQIQDLKSRDAQIKKTIKDLQSFGKNLNDTQRQQIKDLTAESIKINTVDIPNAQKKQKQARVADAEQFDIFSQINEQIDNGNITPEQVDEFVNDDRKAEEIEPIVEVIESKAKGYNKVELEEVAAEVDAVLANEEKIYSVRDLAEMQEGELSASVFSSLEKGDVFKVGNKTYEVTTKSKGKVITEFENKKGKKVTYTKDRLTIKERKPDGTLGKPISGNLIRYSNGNTSFSGEGAWSNLSRDIEGDITIDLINENNPLHNKSDSYNLAKKTINNINKQQLKDKANAEVDKIADKIKGLLPGIKDPNLKNQGFSQDQLIDLIASAVKNLVSAGIDINEAIKQVVDSVKAKFGDIDIDIEAVKERVSPKQKVTQQPIINTPPKQQNKKPIDKESIEKDSFEDMAGKMPNSGIVGEFLSGKTTEKTTGNAPEGNQEYDKIKLIEAFAHGKNIINKAIEQFGDNYVASILDYIENYQLNPENIALAYISLENHLRDMVKMNPTDITIKKQFDLVQSKRQNYAKSVAQAMNMAKLQNMAYYGYDLSETVDLIFTESQLETKRKIERAIQASADDINNEAEFQENEAENDIEEITIKAPKRKRNANVVKKELDDVWKNMLNDIAKSTKDGSLQTALPYQKQIIAATPHILKATQLLAELGTLSSKQIIDEIYNKLKTSFPDIERSDVVDIIKNENNKPKTISKIVKKALIDAGFGREVNITKKDENGNKIKEKRNILDWKKLAGEEGSIENIKKNVEETLKKQGYSEQDIKDIQSDLEAEYTNLRASIIEKSLNELERRNTPKNINAKTHAQRLAELYNYGLFETNASEYDNLLNGLLGMNDFDNKTYEQLKQRGKALAELYATGLDPLFISTKIDELQKQINDIVYKFVFKNGGTTFRVVSIISEYMNLAQRMMLHSLGQIIQNPFSGATQIALTKAGSTFNKNSNKELRKQRNKVALNILNDITGNAALSYGNVESNFSSHSKIEDIINSRSENKVYHRVITSLLGKMHLEAADSYFKTLLTTRYFTNNLIKILTDKTNPNGAMSKQEALRYVTENLTGQSFSDAMVKARDIINDINEKAGKKLLSDKEESVVRFADGIVKATLLKGGKLTQEQIEASYKAGYTSAGFDLGHEANNVISKQIGLYNAQLDRKIKDSVKEKKYGKASIYLLEGILTKNMLNAFVGGGTNWIVLTLQKAGLDYVSLVRDNILSRSEKIDLSSDSGIKGLKETLLRNTNAKNTNTRMAIGAMVSISAFLLWYDDLDDEEKDKQINPLKTWLSKNTYAKKYFNYISPTVLGLIISAENEELGKETGKILGIKSEIFNDGSKLVKAVSNLNKSISINGIENEDKYKKAKGDLGKLLGNKFSTPLPWRSVRDIENFYRGMNGLPEYKTNYKATSFTDGFFKGGMIEYLKSNPDKPEEEDTEE